jgi:hypothetical protein
MPIDALLGHSARLAVVSLHLPCLVNHDVVAEQRVSRRHALAQGRKSDDSQRETTQR